MAFEQRTPAEQRMDDLSSELRRLRALAHPSAQQRVRIREIENHMLPSARRVVQDMRAGRR